MSNVVPRHLAPQLVDPGDPKANVNPTLVVPFEVRGVIGRLWACNTHLFPGGGLSLFASIRVFMDDHGLLIDAVPEICTRMMSPERRAGHKFAADFFTDLASIVADVVRRRRFEMEQQKRQRDDLQERQIAGSSQILIDRLRAQIGRDVNQQEESTSQE